MIPRSCSKNSFFLTSKWHCERAQIRNREDNRDVANVVGIKMTVMGAVNGGGCNRPTKLCANYSLLLHIFERRTRESLTDRCSWTCKKQEVKHILDAFKSF